jgi:glutathione S-transferase
MGSDRLGICIPNRMAEASLTVSSKNYSSWSLRGFLLCRMAGLEFAEKIAPIDDPATRAELLLLSPSFLVPCLEHGKVKVWDTLAIAEYLNEIKPRQVCCRLTRWRAPIAGRCAARCIRASPTCARRCP